MLNDYQKGNLYKYKIRGFTLIELLAVIVILAVISVIAVPIISKIVEETKRSAAISSIYRVAAGAKNYAIIQLSNDNKENITYSCDYEGCFTVDNDVKEYLEFSGNIPSSGQLIVDKDGSLLNVVDMIINEYICSKDQDSEVDCVKIENMNVVVTFNSNGEDVATKNVTYYDLYGNLENVERVGYIFEGWYTKPDGQGVRISSKNKVLIPNAHTLYAYYTEDLDKIYDVLKDAAATGTYAKKYIGLHQDSTNSAISVQPIYYWYAEESVDGTEILNKNNVIFGGFCWQMIRTTDTGGVRLLYNGVPTISGSGDTITYDCGTSRPGQIGKIKSIASLNGNYFYADDYEVVSVSGNVTTYRLKSQNNPITQVLVNDSNASTNINNIVSNYQYTCMALSPNVGCTKLYKVDSYISGSDALVYETSYRDSIGVSKFNNNSTSPADIGYMYNLRYSQVDGKKSETIGTKQYLIGDNLSDNLDGTFTLNNASLIDASNWSSNYSNYVSKIVCLPGYYNASTHVCSDGENGTYVGSTNPVQAIGYITTTSDSDFSYVPMYKYGYDVVIDSGSTYKLVGDGSTKHKLQYVYNWGNSNVVTSNAANFSNQYSDNGNLSNYGHRSTNYSHYTCLNLSGKCDTYYYLSYTDVGNMYYVPISNGKKVHTSISNTNNIIYDMLYSSNVNVESSIIKNNIDNWYVNNLSAYDRYIEQTIYCNNRSILSFGGWDFNGGYAYGTTTFKENTLSNDLSCLNSTDKFNLKVALMSSAEMNLLNQNSARVSTSAYWLISPYGVNSQVYNRNIAANGNIRQSSVSNSNSVRPAISLIPNLRYSKGNGSVTNPYVIVNN